MKTILFFLSFLLTSYASRTAVQKTVKVEVPEVSFLVEGPTDKKFGKSKFFEFKKAFLKDFMAQQSLRYMTPLEYVKLESAARGAPLCLWTLSICESTKGFWFLKKIRVD